MTKKIEKKLDVAVAKADESLGVVFGYALICKEFDEISEGFEDYVDLQNDIVEEDAMLQCAFEFMQGDRVAKVQHKGDQQGTVVFALPVTEEIAKSLDIDVTKTGLIIGVKFDDDAVLKAFADGTLTGFSIGGYILEQE